MPDLDDATAWRAALAMLQHPQAVAAAVAETGLFASVPQELASHLPRTLTGQSALDVVAPADRPALIEAWEQVRTAGGASLIVRMVEPTGEERPVNLCFFDVRPRFGVYLAVGVPTTEAVPARGSGGRPEEPVRPRFARVVKNQLARYVEVDEAMSALLGWERHELVGRRSLDFVHPDDQDLALASWMELLAAPGMGRRVRLRHVRKDGGYAWHEVTNHNGLDDPDPAKRMVICEVVDISEEMAAHEAARAREQLLHRLAEALPVGVLQIGVDGEVVYGNSRLAELVGREPGALADVVAAVAPADRERLQAAFRSVLDEGRAGAEAQVELPGEQLRVWSVSIRGLDDGAGRSTGAVACLTDVTDSTRLQRELHRRATVDPLTGALNRAGTDDVLREVCGRAGAGTAVLFADLDDFKTVNDELGHEAGDAALVQVADALRRGCRSTDSVGRLGGDEFLVVCPDLDRAAAEAVRDRVVEVLRTTGADDPAAVAVSVGLAWEPPGRRDPVALVARADVAMYEAKAARRARLPVPRPPAVGAGAR